MMTGLSSDFVSASFARISSGPMGAASGIVVQTSTDKVNKIEEILVLYTKPFTCHI